MATISSKRIQKPEFISVLSLILISLLLVSCQESKNESTIYQTSNENLTNPLGLGTQKPGFSWKSRSAVNGTMQSAYQIVVASDSMLLSEKTADLWNSGKVSSTASIHIPYQGKEITSRAVGYWKVRTWDENKNVSEWSKSARFTIGLLNPNDWQADYIGLPEGKDKPESPMLRTTFSLSKAGQMCLLYINSLGYHEIYLNGKKVGTAVLSPAVAQFNKRSQVITYDVSDYLKVGENDLVIWLGRGWYNMGLPGVVNNGPLVRAQLEQMNSGKWETVAVTNQRWKGRESAYIPTGNWRAQQFGGEQLDGAKIITDWSSENLNKLGWLPVAQVTIPAHQATAQLTEPNRIQETIKAQNITKISDNSYLVDMGKSLTGWLQVNFPSLQKGQKITLGYCDHLDENGKFIDRNQEDSYVASGIGAETFINKFNYQGFRYVRISNISRKPFNEAVTGYLIHTDYKLASTFKCSDDDINSIHNMIFYTLRCLSLGGYLVDCPQLERLGYGGDGNASTEAAQTMFDLAPLYSNWLQAWGDCIREDGGMPHTAPNPYSAGGGPYWCSFIVSATWKSYLNYGDSRILEKYYPVMQQWLGYVDKYSTSGLLKKWPDTDYRVWYLGDWASPKGINERSESSVDLVNNSAMCMTYNYMQKIAKVLGKKDDIQKYAQKGEALKKVVHQTFFNPAQYTYADGYQIDMAYPLLAGVTPDSLVQPVKRSLYNEIEQNRGGHIACGLVGVPVFTEWAIKNRATDLVYSMLKKKDYPGYLYMIENGATTTWEEWSNPRSYIHNCFNGIGTWFYQAVGGIRQDLDLPAYQRVLIQPQIPKGITWANTSKETPFGLIVLNWKLEGNDLKMHLEIPVGATAKVIIPEGIQDYILNQKQFQAKMDQNFIEISSGKYELSYNYKAI